MSNKGYGHGGTRENSGRKFKYGVPTRRVSIPIGITDEILDKFVKDCLKQSNLVKI